MKTKSRILQICHLFGSVLGFGSLLLQASQATAQNQVTTKVETPQKSVSRANVNLWAVPNSPYSLTKNTPTYKEYVAYATIGARVSMDPNDSHLEVNPFWGGVSDFSVDAQINGHDILPDQRYWWEAPGYYIPVIPPPIPDNDNTVIAVRNFAGAVDQTVITFSPALDYLYSNWNLSPTGLVIPEWWEDLRYQSQLSAAYAQPPSNWRADVPTNADKTFHWNFGETPDNLPVETTTSVGIGNDEPNTPAVARGTVKIKWIQPPYHIYDMELATFQRNGDTNTYSNFLNYFGSFAFNTKLTDELKKDGCIMAIAPPVFVAGTNGAKWVFRVATARAVNSAFMARVGGNALAKAAERATIEDAIVVPKQELSSQAAHVGSEGTELTKTKDTRLAGEGTTPDERSPQTKTDDNCFSAGTAVVMSDGSSKPIESVKAGDVVLSRNPKSGSFGGRVVLKTVSHYVERTLLISTKNIEVRTTADHPFFHEDPAHVGGYNTIPAGRLVIGNSIITRAGPSKIRRIREIYERTKVYNISVDDLHTFFVGANPKDAIWVHNSGKNCFEDENPNNDPAPETDGPDEASPLDSDASDSPDGSRDVTEKASGAEVQIPLSSYASTLWEKGFQRCRDVFKELPFASKMKSFTRNGKRIITSSTFNANYYRKSGEDAWTELDMSCSGDLAPTYDGGSKQMLPSGGKWCSKYPDNPWNIPSKPELHADPKSLDEYERVVNREPAGTALEFHMHIYHDFYKTLPPCISCHRRILDFVAEHNNATILVTHSGDESRGALVYFWDGTESKCEALMGEAPKYTY